MDASVATPLAEAFRSLWRCVGRERELVTLLDLQAASAADGRGRVALVSGAAGIGKSRLVEEMKRRLAARGVLVADGRCGEGSRCWQPAHEVVTQVVRALADAGAVPLSVRGAELAGWLRGSATVDDRAPAPGPEGDRLALFETAASFLTEASRVLPLVIVIHDLHRGDGATRALLRYLAQTRCAAPEFDGAPGASQGPGPGPVADPRAAALLPAGPDDRLQGLLVLTSREAEAGWLAGASLAELPLGALDDSGVREFLQSPEVVRLVTEATGGRPRALEALLEGAGASDDDHRQMLGALQGLSPAARSLIEALAVLATIDRPLSSEALCRVAGLPAAGLPEAAVELAAARLAARRVVDGELRLAIARSGGEEVVRRGLAPERRRQLHLAVGRELAARRDPADGPAIAEHLLAGGAGEQAVEAAFEAGRHLEATMAHERAIALYRAAHAATSRDEVRAALESRLVELQRLTGDYDGALADAERLLARRPDHPASLRSVGQLFLLRDQYGAAREALARARELALHDGDQIELARVIAAFAEVCLLDGRHEDATAECEVGLHVTGPRHDDAAESPEAVRLRIEIRNTLGKVHLAEGRYTAAEALFVRNLDEAREHRVPFEEARACINQGIARQWLGQHEEAAGCYQAGLKVATAAADHRHRAFCLQNLGVLALWRSEYTTALRYFHEAVSAFKRLGQRGRLAWIALDLASLYLELGATGRAEAMASLADRMGDRTSGATVRHKRAVVAARLARASGHLDDARLLLDGARAAAAPTAPELYAEASTFLGWLELEAGATGAAAAVVEDAHGALVTRPPSLAARARLAHLRGEVELAQGALASARRSLLEACDTFHRLGDLDGEWRAHFALARAAVGAGDAGEAERRHRRAAQVDARLLERVPEELRPHLSEDPARLALQRSLASLGPVAPPVAVRAAARLAEARTPATATTPPPCSFGPAAAADRFERLIGRHPRMRQVYALIDKVARHPSVVLIRGESGTGKELVAEALHVRSPRAAEALVKVNCGALVETLLLSELFGHERGAFTGAVQRKKGRFEAADRGTIFLDEIGDISPRTQAALLRVIQEREFERVGATTPVKVDVRIICATNRDLEAMVARGEFREDLYYRLKGIQIDLPPLRDRADDVPLLAGDLMSRVAEERGGGPRGIAPEAMERLLRYRWPGNVRELENIIRSVTLFAEGERVTLGDLRDHPQLLGQPAAARGGGASPSMASAMREVEGAAWERLGSEGLGLRELQEKIEIECITRALAESGGNITRAAEILKMKRPRLSQLIKEHGIALPRDEGTSCVES